MSGARLHTLLPELTSRQPVMVVGAAVIDVIADAYALPWRGCDIELKQQSVNVGMMKPLKSIPTLPKHIMNEDVSNYLKETKTDLWKI